MDTFFLGMNYSIFSKEKQRKKLIKTLTKTQLVSLFSLCVIFGTLPLSARTADISADMPFMQEEKHTISGSITDAGTGETLIGSTVVIKGTTTGSVSNVYGFYSLTIPKGSHTLQISYVGFETLEMEIDLTEDKKIDIELTESSSRLEEVVIEDESLDDSQVNKTMLGIVNIKRKEIKDLPALLGEADVTRTMLTMPGVTTVGEGATGFNVRGGNIDQNLILLDEAPIYNSSHAWGFFSVFNADAIKDMKFYKGGIPARYGGRGSSVLDIRQREGSTKKFKGEGGIGLLFSRLTLEGPIKKDKLSFLVSGRRSYFDLFFPLLGGEIKNQKFYFYDTNAKIAWQINDKNKLFASGYFGADVMRMSFGSGDNNNSADNNNTGNNSNNNKKNEDDKQKINFLWKNATATLRWNSILSSKLFMNLSAIYSSYRYELSSQNTAGSAGGGGGVGSNSFVWKSIIDNWIIKPDFTYYKDANTELRFGLNSTLYRFTPASVTSNDKSTNDVKFDVGKGLEVAPYASIEKKWNKLTVYGGLRFSWFAKMGANSVSTYDPNLPRIASSITSTKRYKDGEIMQSYTGIEPRLSMKYNLTENKVVKLGYNRMYQYIHLISNTASALPFDIYKLSGPHIKPLVVNQISTGYAFDTPDRLLNISFEAYYKTFSNMVEYKDGAQLFLNKNLETELLAADGYSYGFEASLYKNKGKLYGNANYTYSVTKRKVVDSHPSLTVNNGKYYPSNFDRPHVFNLTANYKLGKNWTLGSFFTYQTGRPNTLAVGKYIDDEGTTVLSYSDRNAYRITDTHRLDISFTYSKFKPNKKKQSSWSFGCYNVYANKNAFSQTSRLIRGTVTTYKFSVIGAPIPYVTYNFNF